MKSKTELLRRSVGQINTFTYENISISKITISVLDYYADNHTNLHIYAVSNLLSSIMRAIQIGDNVQVHYHKRDVWEPAKVYCKVKGMYGVLFDRPVQMNNKPFDFVLCTYVSEELIKLL